MAGNLKRKIESTGSAVVETIPITAADDAAQKVTLSNPSPTEIFLTIPGGTTQIEDFDYEIINTNEVSWAGKALETTLSEGDTIIVIYNNN
jgi:hypothetical protein